MKKVLIVLLSVLLAFSFISCEKDKSGEVIQNYEDYMKSANVASNLSRISRGLINKYKDSGTGIANKDFSDSDKSDILSLINNGSNIYYVKELLDLDDITITEVESVSGKLQGTTADYTASDITIKFKYTVSGSSDSVEGQLKFSIKYSGTGTENDYTISYSSLSLQDVSYKDIKYTVDKNTEKYTSATVGGASVEVRLLNAMPSNY